MGRQGGGGGDPQQMLSRLPAIQIADLKKGDAVMLVATDGATDFTAITLLAGVDAAARSSSSEPEPAQQLEHGLGAPDAGMRSQ